MSLTLTLNSYHAKVSLKTKIDVVPDVTNGYLFQGVSKLNAEIKEVQD